jgi:hypothetical protein
VWYFGVFHFIGNIKVIIVVNIRKMFQTPAEQMLNDCLGPFDFLASKDI